MIGDLALAGLPLLGAYRSVRGGHKLNNARADGAAGRPQRLARGRSRRPPARPVRGHVEAGRSAWLGGLVAPAYGPDVS